MLMACSSVQVLCGHGLPSKICKICVKQLTSAGQVNEIKEELQNSDFMEPLSTLDSMLNEEQSDATKGSTPESIPALVAPKIETDYIQFMDVNQIIQTCSECGKTFPSLEDLHCHKCIHTGGMYKCKQCDKEYTEQNHLQCHEQMHSTRKVYVCRICRKTFARMENLKRHLIIHLKEKPYSCKTCNRGFNRIKYLQHHVPRCKGDTVYPCDICNKLFNREDSMEIHKKTHKNEQGKLLTIENLDNVSDHYYQIDQDENITLSDHSDVEDCFESLMGVMESMGEERIQEVTDVSNLQNESNIRETLAPAPVDYNDSSVDTVVDENLECEKVDDKNEVKVKEETISLLADVAVDDDDNVDIATEGVDDNFGDVTDSECLSKKGVSPRVKHSRRGPHKSPSTSPKTSKVKVHPSTKSIKTEEKEEVYGEFPCPTCHEMFHWISQLDKHTRQKHEGLKVHRCPECSMEFSRASELKKHVTSHSPDQQLQCAICMKSFKKQKYLSQHQKLHERSKNKCDICEESFKQVNRLVKHKATKHGIGEKEEVKIVLRNGQKRYQCEVCEKTYPAKSNLMKHMKFHDDHSKKFLCSECGRRFIRNEYLVVHMRRHRGEKPFKCKFCGKGFPRSTELILHERYHTGEKTHLCTICGKGFGRAYSLTVHMRTHTGEKPYQCTYCDAAFAQGSVLKAHVRIHTGERFHCDLCTESFIVGYLLTQHKRTVHGLNIVSNISRLLPIHKQENPDEPPPITTPLPKAEEMPDNDIFNTLQADTVHSNTIHPQLTMAQLPPCILSVAKNFI